MPDPSSTDPALPLIHEGWDHLQHQRPLAAWASWRRALRLTPEQPAATRALDVLANAGDLPEAARAEYRFLTPVGEGQRARWDALFRGRNLEELTVAAEAFQQIASEDPADGRARFNQGLCLSWLGKNLEAVEALGLAVQGLAVDEPGAAVDAWTLAEVLRQGGGAEPIADDLSHAVTLTWTPGEDPVGFLDEHPDLRAVPNPVDPSTGQPRLSDAKLYEWLEGPESGIRRVRATVIRSPRTLRLSGTDPILLAEARDEVVSRVEGRIASIRAEATPLPLAFLDAALWAIRLPAEADEDERASLNRSAVERYYEGAWLRRPRLGLDGKSPVEAGRLASGDPVMRARLSAVVRLREQLGARPTTALLYQGYPFDRLRRRLGLEPTDPEAIEPSDPSSMSAEELDRLDPSPMVDPALADAYESAAALGDDARTARFAEVLADRDPVAMARLDVPALFATLIRHALAGDDPDLALRRVDQAQEVDRALHAGAGHRTFETWRAEILARAGRPDASALVYRNLLDRSPSDAALALDAAETLLDNGFDDHARELARLALEVAREVGDLEVAERAETIA
ncbi:hypothetical protein P12x_000758 [Tundrisphaera lichenicola]|uniref:hypothetical protein n=1 Tax=Tundrisphaera lichenicola TaxID=2029860 RepID=UPI003EC08F81